MRPLSSATAMNAAGGRIEPSCSVIRASASKPATMPVGQIDDGLVVHDDPVVVQRRLQHPLSVRSLLDLTAEGGVEDLGTPPTERLRPVHGLVGLVEQDLRRPSSADRDGDADARRDRVTVFGPIRRRHNSATIRAPMSTAWRWLSTSARGRRTRRRRCGRRCPSGRRIDSNWVATLRSTVSPAACPRESLTCLNRSRSTKKTAVHRPERFECGQGLVDAVDEQRTVRQTGQRVVCRLLRQRGLGVLQVGHPLGLSPAEPVDLAILRLLGAEVGEGQAGEIVAIHREG